MEVSALSGAFKTGEVAFDFLLVLKQPSLAVP